MGSGNRKQLVLVLYQPGSHFDQEIQANERSGTENYFRIGRLAGNSLYLIANTTPDGASSSGAQDNPSGPSCGQYCSGPVNLCTGYGGCKCVADPWQGTGSGFFTGSCKLPYSAQDSGRELMEIDPNITNVIEPISASVVPIIDESTMACPCNCSYVSKACCLSTSGIVFEASNLKLGALLPPNNSTFCNSTIAQFESRD